MEQSHAASLQHKSLMRRKRAAARRNMRCTYTDCLKDTSPVPTGANGTTLYQTLMVGGMTAISVTVNGVSSDGLGFLVNEH